MGVTLGKKQLNKGRISLYLNYSHNGKRRKEYLGIIISLLVIKLLLMELLLIFA